MFQVTRMPARLLDRRKERHPSSIPASSSVGLECKQKDAAGLCVVCVCWRDSLQTSLWCLLMLLFPFSSFLYHASGLSKPWEASLQNDILAKAWVRLFSRPLRVHPHAYSNLGYEGHHLNRPSWHISLTRCGPTPSVISEGFRERRVRVAFSTVAEHCAMTVQH